MAGDSQYQRISARKPVMQPGTLSYLDGEEDVTVDCFVRDVSEHGAGIECDSSLVLPKQVTLEFGDGQQYVAEIAWRLEKRIGLRFRQMHRRQSVRRRQFKPAQLVIADTGTVIDCRLRDISEHGAGIECQGAQHVPPKVTLKIGDETQYEADVVWQTEHRLGLRFILQPSTGDVMETLTQHRGSLETCAKGMLEVRDQFQDGRYTHLNHPDLAARLDQVVASADALLDAIDGLIVACQSGGQTDDGPASDAKAQAGVAPAHDGEAADEADAVDEPLPTGGPRPPA